MDVFISADPEVDLGLFNFEFRITPAGGATSYLQFVDPQPDPQLTDPEYVFFGNSAAATFPFPFPVGTVGITGFPQDKFIGGDFTADPDDVQLTSERLLARLQVTTSNLTGFVPEIGDTFILSLEPTDFTFFWNRDFEFEHLFTSSSGTVSVVVPEPGSFALWAFGVTFFAAATRYRRWHKRAA